MKIVKKWNHMGLKCVVKRHGEFGGYFCGYVIVPKKHPAYGKTCYELDEIDVHGGLTYAVDGTLGFDCAHGNDYLACMPKEYNQKAHKWTLDEVVQETEKLAFQLAKMQEAMK